MPQATGSATLGLGMVQIPVKLIKASTDDAPELERVCDECGSTDLGFVGDEDGNKYGCNDCGEARGWWSSFDRGAFELGDEIIHLDSEKVEELGSEPAVENPGNIEAAPGVEETLVEYAVVGNYYLVPQEDFNDQYGVLVRVLQDEHKCLLTYLHIRGSTRRYAIISRGGVLVALQLADKRPLGEQIEWDVDKTMEAQAKSMFDGLTDDPELPDMEGQPLKDLMQEQLEEEGEDEDEARERVMKAV